MIRNICKINSSKNPVLMLQNGIVHNVPKHSKELNSIKLMGTIQQNVERLPNGAINLYLKTLNEDFGHSIHKVAVANHQLLKMIGNRLVPDQRIYVGGRIKSDGKFIGNWICHEIEIMANELFILEMNPKLNEKTIEDTNEIAPFQMDQNSVEMLANIGTEVNVFDKKCTFCLKTHFTKRKGTPMESTGSEYHSVVVGNNDPTLFNLAKNLRKSDRIYLNGCIEYESKRYEDGNKYTTGFLRPSNLVRLKQFITSNQHQLKYSV